MSTTTATTETREGRPQLLVRTSHFLKKVSNLRTIRRKSDSRTPGDASYTRSARSMDLGPKALTKVEVRARHHSFDHSGDSEEDSPSHGSLRSPSNPRNSLQITESPLATPPREIEGLPSTNNHPPFPTVNGSTPNSVHVRAQTLPSSPSSASDNLNGNGAQSTTIDGRTRRAIAPRLATLPPPLMAQYAAGGSARLTPSLVTRQPPMPIFNLPTLPPPTPAQPARHAPLRSLPALPMQGPSDADQEADVEDASLEEEEDEEEGDDNAEGNGQDVGSEESGDEDDESSPSLTSSNNAGPSRLAPLPQVDLSGFSVSFGDAGISSSMQQFMQHTPHLHPADPPVDYFSAKSLDPVHSPLRTPRPSDYRPNGKARAFDGVPQPRLVPMPATPGSPRPGLYHQGSKSMVDLTAAMVRKDKDKVITPKLGRTPPRKAQTLGQDGQAPAAEAEDPATTEPLDDVITSPMLRRRRSLPVYEPSSDPPPYPDPLFRRRGQPSSQPREEEGREQLPAYSNSIYLSGIMPRKMEFSQPGVQAKDRKWRRVYCVLEGTAFRVYKCPPAASGVSAIEQWWENRVGVGDLTSVNITAITSTGIRVSAIRERQRESTERIPKIVEESGTGQDMQSPSDRPEEREASQSSPAPTKSKLGLASRFLRKERSKSVDPLRSNSANSSRTRLSMDSRSDAARQPSIAASRRSMDTLSSSRPSNVSTTSPSTTSTNLTVPSPTSASSISSEGGSRFSRSRLLSHHSSRREHHRDFNREKEKEETYTPDPKDLIHQYSLQHAESGLASDYQKRKNVIRVRMEGEQFLLQAKDVAAVIDWIEGIQMGTNVALDLDERPMPRGPIFPRRRRRRVRRVDPAVATAS